MKPPSLLLSCQLISLALLLQNTAQAQVATATLPTGVEPYALVVNPTTNKIYIANAVDDSVTIVDGATNTTNSVSVGLDPISIAINPATNKIYVGNYGDATVTVIDGATNLTTTVTSGRAPRAIAVNPVTNKIYVANGGQSSASIIDGVTNQVTSIPTGTTPLDVVVNPITNKVYVSNADDTLTIIDGASNTTTSITLTGTPYSMALNPVTNKLYIANSTYTATGNVTVLDGATNSTLSVPVGVFPLAIEVNPTTNQIFVANYNDDTVTQIDGSTNKPTTINLVSGAQPERITIDQASNKTYVAGFGGVEVIDGSSSAPTVIANVAASRAIAANPVTGKIYAAQAYNPSVTVIDGSPIANATITTVAIGNSPTAVAVNSVTNKSYVVTTDLNNALTIVDNKTRQTTVIPLGQGGDFLSLAINTATNKIYVASKFQYAVYVIDGATDALVQKIAIGVAPEYLAINPVTNAIYVTNSTPDNSFITIIDGATNSFTNLSLGENLTITGVAVNPVTNRIYVEAVNGLFVVNGVTNTFITLPMTNLGLNSVVVNSTTNKIYVGAAQYVVNVVDGVTNAITPVTTLNLSPQSLQVDELTNKIYAGGGITGVTVIDGATNATTLVPGAGFGPLVLNPVLNKVYSLNSNSIAEIDGATNTISSLYIGNIAGLAVNPITGQIFVADEGASGLDIITEEQHQSSGPDINITSVTGTQFSFSALSSSTTSPTGVYFQVDTWQGAWTKATGTNPTFTGTLALWAPGVHTLYAYAVDGQEATSTQPSSPLIGSIQAYTLLVAPSASSGGSTGSNASAFITAQNPGALRNNYSGFVGFQFSTGPSAIQVASLGRFVATGNSGTHLLKLVQASGTDVPDGSATVTINTSPGEYQYAPLTSPVTLAANSTYYLVSQESAGADNWYDIGSVTASSIATVTAPAYTDGSGNYIPVPGLTGDSFVPVNFLFSIGTTTQAPSGTSFVTTQTLGALRNNYSGFVGFSFTPSQSVTVNALGRYVAPGNKGNHLLQLVSVDNAGNPTTIAFASVSLAGATPGQFSYISLTNSITLAAKTTYYLLSQETNGGDSWYDIGPIAVTSIAQVLAPVYTNGSANYTSVAGLPGDAYVPLSFLYTGNTSPPPTNTLVTSQTASTLRNNYTGFAGMSVQVGATPITVTSLGRYVVAGNTGAHIVKLVQANGTDLPGASVSLSLAAATPGQYLYAALTLPLTLAANTTYYLVSQETNGEDFWYDLEPVTSSAAAQILGPTYTDANGNFIVVSALPNYSFVPVNLQYQ